MSGTAQLCVQGTWRWTQEGFAMLLKNSSWNQCFFLKSSNCQRGCYSTNFLQINQTRERVMKSTATSGENAAIFKQREDWYPPRLRFVLPIFRVIQQFLYMFGWLTSGMLVDYSCRWFCYLFDLCMLCIFYTHFQLHFFWPADPEMITSTFGQYFP